jgi:hypothetical protein
MASTTTHTLRPHGTGWRIVNPDGTVQPGYFPDRADAERVIADAAAGAPCPRLELIEEASRQALILAEYTYATEPLSDRAIRQARELDGYIDRLFDEANRLTCACCPTVLERAR